ncbi:unnamed protein product [Nesidiocoris tenuis]|uniref:Uncharacterized protein n=1 Tax=Nesidiocoris tenuis TaxID=355587 RepID=A0A6H5GQS5_9HEMI|nr:unnamed protein product [Nesidiocoris tenuis]
MEVLCVIYAPLVFFGRCLLHQQGDALTLRPVALGNMKANQFARSWTLRIARQSRIDVRKVIYAQPVSARPEILSRLLVTSEWRWDKEAAAIKISKLSCYTSQLKGSTMADSEVRRSSAVFGLGGSRGRSRPPPGNCSFPLSPDSRLNCIEEKWEMRTGVKGSLPKGFSIEECLNHGMSERRISVLKSLRKSVLRKFGIQHSLPKNLYRRMSHKTVSTKGPLTRRYSTKGCPAKDCPTKQSLPKDLLTEGDLPKDVILDSIYHLSKSVKGVSHETVSTKGSLTRRYPTKGCPAKDCPTEQSLPKDALSNGAYIEGCLKKGCQRVSIKGWLNQGVSLPKAAFTEECHRVTTKGRLTVRLLPNSHNQRAFAKEYLNRRASYRRISYQRVSYQRISYQRLSNQKGPLSRSVKECLRFTIKGCPIEGLPKRHYQRASYRKVFTKGSLNRRYPTKRCPIKGCVKSVKGSLPKGALSKGLYQSASYQTVTTKEPLLKSASTIECPTKGFLPKSVLPKDTRGCPTEKGLYQGASKSV